MGLSDDTTKHALEVADRVLELTQALENAETPKERDRIRKEIKELAMDELGVKGTA